MRRRFRHERRKNMGASENSYATEKATFGLFQHIELSNHTEL